VDKVLIYRYFGGLSELLRAFAEQGEFWPSTEDITRSLPSYLKKLPGSAASIAVLKGYLRELRKNPAAQEILREELIRRDGLACETAEAREKQRKDLIDSLALDPSVTDFMDITAVASLLSAGMTYLLLKGKTTGKYLGMDLNSEQDWNRIEEAAEDIVSAVFHYAEYKRARNETQNS
jgi:hypothetical protein